LNENISQQLFAGACYSETAWRRKAAQLYQAAMLILEDGAMARSTLDPRLFEGGSRSLTKQESYELQRLDSHEVGFFLLGLVFENLLKGLYVMHNPPVCGELEDIRSGLNGIANHNLKELARKACFKISTEEDAIFVALNEHISWVGRYPVPLKRKDYHHTLSTGHPSYRLSSAKSIFQLELPLPPKVSALLNRLVAEYDEVAAKYADGLA